MLTDRVILITGATDGIGQQTALELARLGARVLVHGRSRARGEAVVEEIRRATGNQQVDLLLADFADQVQVRGLAEQVRARTLQLHVLINNAGVYLRERRLTPDGLEMTFAVNHLAPFLLTHLLLDTLKHSAPARIVNVSSTAHQSARLEFDNLQGERRYDGYRAYALSKLGNVLFTCELAERLRGSNVTANCLHPGVIDTKLLHAGFNMRGASLEQGAQTPVYLAASPTVEGVTGQYFVNQKAVRSAPATYDQDLCARFWQVSEKLVGLAGTATF